ncbi:MAG: response regulator [Candidatus Brocadiia bacterium]
MKILLVDDSLVIRTFVKEALTKDGHKVVEAVNGTEGIAMYGPEQPDFVILDYEMPDFTGLETFKRIKQSHPKAKGVLLTAFLPSSEELSALKKEAEEAGIVQFLHKGGGTANVIAMLKKIIPSLQLRVHTVLMAEENTSLVTEVKNFLASKNFIIIQVVNMADILAKMGSTSPSVIVLNSILNNENGFIILKKIRDIDKTMKVVMTISTKQEEQLAQAALKMPQLGLTNYLSKPYTPQAMLDVLSKVV